MAFHVDNSPYWYVSITSPHTGERVKRSTKTKIRKEAEALEAKWNTEARQDAFWGDALAKPITLHTVLDDYLQNHTAKRSSESLATSCVKPTDKRA